MNTQSNDFNFDIQIMKKLLSPQDGFDFGQSRRPMTEAEIEEAEKQLRIISIWCKSCKKD
jgi:hypothetical protein